MTPEEVLAIIKAFFDAVLRVLRALGFIKKPEEPSAAPEETS